MKQGEVEGSKDATPNSGKCQDEEEQTKNPKAEVKTSNPPKKQNLETDIKTLEPPKKQNPVDTIGKSVKQIGEPITFVTPLQSTQGNIEEGWIFNEEMRPIRVEELSLNEFFFDKKRKAVVKRKFYQEGESTAKKYKVMTNGKNKKNEQFTTKIAGTLGAYALGESIFGQTFKEPTQKKKCWLWISLTENYLPWLMQRSFALLLAVFIPHEVFTPQKYVHSSTRGSAEGGYPLCGVRGVHPPGWGVWGQAGPQKPPKQKLPYKSIL
jgi:hypothetical protein